MDDAIWRDLGHLLENRPDITRRLAATRSLEEAAETLARIAAEHGLPVSGAELSGYFKKELMARTTRRLDDAALDWVAGGGPELDGAAHARLTVLFASPRDWLLSPPHG
jgi:hypothetical protein